MSKLLGLSKEIIVWDSEFTAWDGSYDNGWTAPGQFKELIQIGAVRVRTSDFAELDRFEVYIKPTINPILSAYFIELTGITQEKINRNGLLSKKALPMFFNWVKRSSLYSWGITDYWALAETCKINNIILPLNKDKFYDVRMIFWKKGVMAEDYQSSTIVKAFSQKPKRAAHSAINDARTIVDGLTFLSDKLR